MLPDFIQKRGKTLCSDINTLSDYLERIARAVEGVCYSTCFQRKVIKLTVVIN
jgi:hypothetical protein